MAAARRESARESYGSDGEVEIEFPVKYMDVMSRVYFDRHPGATGDINVTYAGKGFLTGAWSTIRKGYYTLPDTFSVDVCTGFFRHIADNPTDTTILTNLNPPLVAGAMMEYFKRIVSRHHSDEGDDTNY